MFCCSQTKKNGQIKTFHWLQQEFIQPRKSLVKYTVFGDTWQSCRLFLRNITRIYFSCSSSQSNSFSRLSFSSISYTAMAPFPTKKKSAWKTLLHSQPVTLCNCTSAFIISHCVLGGLLHLQWGKLSSCICSSNLKWSTFGLWSSLMEGTPHEHHRNQAISLFSSQSLPKHLTCSEGCRMMHYD